MISDERNNRIHVTMKENWDIEVKKMCQDLKINRVCVFVYVLGDI